MVDYIVEHKDNAIGWTSVWWYYDFMLSAHSRLFVYLKGSKKGARKQKTQLDTVLQEG